MRAKYTPYLEYKDSGIDAIDTIPLHWETKGVRYLLRDGAEGIKIGPFGSALKLEDMVESGVRVYGQENVINRNFTLGNRSISYLKYKEMGVYTVLPGDLLVTMMGTSGKCELVPKGIDLGIIDSHLLRLRVRDDEVSPRYFRLLVDESHEIKAQIEVSGKGSIMHGLNSSIVKGLELPIPPTNEQSIILAFLDHETAKIDTLIEKQQQLIALLMEKRQAVISHAVTKGLNPDVPMKNSGVEWLGEVPAHWKVSRIKYHTKLFEQGWSPQCDSREAGDNEYGVLKVGCVNGGLFNKTENKALPSDLKPRLQYLIKKHDLLISRANTRELVGSAAVVDKDYEGLILCDKLYRLCFKDTVNPQLVAYYMTLPVVRQQIELGATGASHSMQNIGQSTIKELPIAIPSISESNILILGINNKIKRFDTVIHKAGLQIDLLQERRTALLSAAVTGKIDVRNWKPPITPQNSPETP